MLTNGVKILSGQLERKWNDEFYAGKLDEESEGRCSELENSFISLRSLTIWSASIAGTTMSSRPRTLLPRVRGLAGRDASLVAISDVVLEPMTPARGEPLRNPSVKRFHERFGQHAHSIAWYVDDVHAISARLDDAGFRLFNLVGKQVKPPHKASAVWTHPRETSGQLEFAVYGDYLLDPRMKAGWSSDRWRPPSARDRGRFLDRHRRQRYDESEATVL
jgi:hypothetical protein